MGFKNTNKLLIINADDYGIAQSANQAINKLFAEHADNSYISNDTCQMVSKEITEPLSKTSIQVLVSISLSQINLGQ